MELDETQGLLYDTDREDLKVKVYRGLYVSEANDLDDAFIDEDVPTEVVSSRKKLLLAFQIFREINSQVQSFRQFHGIFLQKSRLTIRWINHTH